MANLKISQLTPGNPAQSGDVIPIERSDVNFSITAGSIAALAPAGVTSVGFEGDGTVLSSTESGPVTGSGILSATLLTQSANLILAGPTTGSAATPTFRSLVSADLPANSPPTGAGFFGGFRIGEVPWNSTASQLWYQANVGDLVAVLFYLDQAITITHITVSVDAANGSATTVDAGLYTQAGSLVANTAGFNGNSATVQTLAVAQGSGSVTLTPGWYWLAWCSETTTEFTQ